MNQLSLGQGWIVQ